MSTSQTTHEINKDWRLDLDPAHPDAFRIYRADGKFFSIAFNPSKWGQPLVYEKADADGTTGSVISIVRKHNDEWQVAVVSVQRACDDYSRELVEGSRFSVSNSVPYLPNQSKSADPQYLSGYNHINSARIADKTLIGVIDWTSIGEPLPANAKWMSFRDFFLQSTDSMTKAVLGQFMVEVLCLG